MSGDKMLSIKDDGVPFRQSERPTKVSDQQAAGSAGQSASSPLSKLLNLRGVGLKFGVGERAAHSLTAASWFPAAIVLGPRIRRWSETEIDDAIAARAPRRAEMAEPAQLAKARARRSSSADAGKMS